MFVRPNSLRDETKALFGKRNLLSTVETALCAHERAELALCTSMPHRQEISSLSMPELCKKVNECRQARVAERVAQREAAEMMTGTANHDDDASSCAARIHASETVIQKFDNEIASLVTAVLARVSPAKTRPPAHNSVEPTSQSQTAAVQAEPSFGAPAMSADDHASTLEHARVAVGKERNDELNQFLDQLTSQSQTAAVQVEPSFGAPAMSADDHASTLEHARVAVGKERNEELNQLLDKQESESSSTMARGSPAPNLEPAQTEPPPKSNKSQAEVELALLLANSPIKDEDRWNESPPRPLHQRRRSRSSMVKGPRWSRSPSPTGKPRAASPTFRKAMGTMNGVNRSQ